ncbi:cadherin-like domain-containing protein [Pararhizobium sp. PWRC1-1]|uniref:cadherin-like domain-containing protein n=1 Tax=Pararhizobium sp. PWRC1-1 TaxID=2804566 RepID=UPI003CF21895
MIEAKGTKSIKEDDPHQRYALKSEEVSSRTPAVIALFLTGFALYLKSAFSSAPGLDENRPDVGTPPEENLPPSKLITGSIPALVKEEEKPEAPAEKKTGGGMRSNGYESEEIELVDFQPFGFPTGETPKPAFQLREQGAPLPSFSASNDNVASRGAGSLATTSYVAPDGNDDEPDEDPDDQDDDDNDEDEDEDDDEDDDDHGVSPINGAPRVNGTLMLMDVSGCAAVLIGLSDLLRGASDPEGTPLTVTDIAVTSGTITSTGDGWLYDWTDLGPVTITYQISDGQLSVAQTAHFSVVKAPPIMGTADEDIVLGTNCGDIIYGLSGDDLIEARAGADTVDGGSGNDNIVAGAGNDIVFAGIGDDIVVGGAGHDQIHGGSGNDRLFGDEGRDILFGDEGVDALNGGSDDDLLFGGDGNDVATGDEGNDVVDGGTGDDALSGGIGNDTVFGQAGHDTMTGGVGNDILVGGADRDIVEGGEGDDTVVGDADQVSDRYDGGEGADTLDFSAILLSMQINLISGSASGQEIGQDTVSNFEVIVAGQDNDNIIGSDEAERIEGGAGDDVVADNGGKDFVAGGTGNDTVIAAADSADDNYDGQSGLDTLDYSRAAHGVFIDLESGVATGLDIGSDGLSSFEHVIGSAQEDVFIVNVSATILEGGGGDDTFKFSMPAGSASGDVIHQILDFMVGDRIEMSRYQIFEEIVDNLEDHFEQIYGVEIDEDALPIRVRHEGTDELGQTLIEIDGDNDQKYEMTINLSGHHLLMVIEAA